MEKPSETKFFHCASEDGDALGVRCYDNGVVFSMCGTGVIMQRENIKEFALWLSDVAAGMPPSKPVTSFREG